MEIFYGTWPWYISGLLLGLVMLTLLFVGKSFGVSSNFRTLCTVLGADKCSDFFRFDWKSQVWNLVVLAGAMLGGWFASQYLLDGSEVQISAETIASLAEIGVEAPAGKFAPDALYGDWSDTKSTLLLLLGGILLGFGSRYAGGCTSGHAISGLSNLQLPSLKAVIGFFIGGLLMSHFLLPILFG